jgi:hypothetical protein
MIEFQFFNGCPNADVTLENLRAVMRELEIPESQLKISVVPDLDTAKRLGFQGSPSILVNRKDIYTGEEPTGFSYACRLYEFDGKQTGIIPARFIKEKVRKLLCIRWNYQKPPKFLKPCRARSTNKNSTI